MHVMIHPIPATLSRPDLYAAVAFELNGSVLEPHELLQHDDRWLGPTDSVVQFDHLQALRRFCLRWLGVRGLVWAETGATLDNAVADMAAFSMSSPFAERQRMELRSVLWTATKIARDNFRLPKLAGVGLTDKPLHVATKHAVMLQAAYRALQGAQVT